MADTGDFSRDKKRKSRVYRKPDRELETFMPDSMRTPIVQVLGKSPISQKSPVSGGHFDGSYTGWEKRGRGRFYGDYDKRGGYHSDWEKRPYYGGADWDKRNNYHGDWEKGNYHSGGRESQGFVDSGRPPGTKSESVAPTIVTPVILSRVKTSAESKAQSATTNSSTPKKEAESSSVTTTSQQQYQIASKLAGLEASVIPENIMKHPAKFLDESLTVCEDISSFLLDQTQFLVLAFIGTQGTGKSTLASMMADPKTDASWSRSGLFRPEGMDQIMSGCHCTNGVDIYVTRDRIILLDLQPLLSPSVMDNAIAQERKCMFDYGSTENTMEVETLQLVTFALSVAHVVLVVQNYTIDPNVMRLLQTCEMMKPSSSSGNMSGRSGSSRVTIGGEEVQQSFPHVVFVHNRSQAHHFVPSTMKQLQTLYHQTFAGSYLEKEGHIGSCNGVLMPPLNLNSCSQLLNLFILPDFNQQQQCPVTFSESIKEMRRQLLGLKRVPLTHVTLTEKSWYQYACRMWENVRKSSLCLEYSRLLP